MMMTMMAKVTKVKDDDGKYDKDDTCMPALGDKGKGGGEKGRGAEEEECFHYLKRISGDDDCGDDCGDQTRVM